MGESKAGVWTRDEEAKLVEGLKQFGKNYKQLSEFMGTRSVASITSRCMELRWKIEGEQRQSKTDAESELLLKILGENARNTRNTWTEEEKAKLVGGLKQFGKDFNKLTQHIGTRSIHAIRLYC